MKKEKVKWKCGKNEKENYNGIGRRQKELGYGYKGNRNDKGKK